MLAPSAQRAKEKVRVPIRNLAPRRNQQGRQICKSLTLRFSDLLS